MIEGPFLYLFADAGLFQVQFLSRKKKPHAPFFHSVLYHSTACYGDLLIVTVIRSPRP
jgi:hypothetical protein